MQRLMGILVITALEVALIGSFFILCGLDQITPTMLDKNMYSGYSFNTIIAGVCGLIYLKIIWKLIQR